MLRIHKNQSWFCLLFIYSLGNKRYILTIVGWFCGDFVYFLTDFGIFGIKWLIFDLIDCDKVAVDGF